jgi:hypothetical protein
MRGVPVRELTFRPATGTPGAKRPARLACGAHDPRCVTAGCVLRPGAGHRRGRAAARDGALSRKRKRARLSANLR